MKIKKVIKAKELQDGDIFYCFLDGDSNECMGGAIDVLTSGNDMIHIADDCGERFDGVIYVNGGIELRIQPEAEVFILGHYSEILKELERLNK